MESILTSIKKLLGIDEDVTNFDTDIIFDINLVLMTLNQLGVGPTTGYSITDKNDVWIDLLGDRKDIDGIKAYIYLEVKLLFDPPTSSFVIDSINRQIQEAKWRINVQIENTEPEEVIPNA